MKSKSNQMEINGHRVNFCLYLGMFYLHQLIIDRGCLHYRENVKFLNFKWCIVCNLHYSGRNASEIHENDIPDSIKHKYEDQMETNKR